MSNAGGGDKVGPDMDWVCDNGKFTSWGQIFDCTDPNSWAYFGIALSLGFSILGAGG